MLTITATPAWFTAFPGATIGLLEVSGLNNTQPSAALDAQKRATETRLRETYQGFQRPQLLALPVMAAYGRYYKRFNKTYHVQLQVESILLKGKALPNVSPLVDSNFIAEVETFILTAGHDVARLQEPITIDLSHEGDVLSHMKGGDKALPPGDMLMRDAHGVCCTIIYGQDDTSPITPQTTHVLYVAYAPPGVPSDSVDLQLRRITDNLRLISSTAVVEQHQLLTASL